MFPRTKMLESVCEARSYKKNQSPAKRLPVCPSLQPVFVWSSQPCCCCWPYLATTNYHQQHRVRPSGEYPGQLTSQDWLLQELHNSCVRKLLFPGLIWVCLVATELNKASEGTVEIGNSLKKRSYWAWHLVAPPDVLLPGVNFLRSIVS